MLMAIYVSSECGATFQASAASQTELGDVSGERSTASIQELESDASRHTSLPNDFESPTMEPDASGGEDDLTCFRKVHVIYDDSNASKV
jgi:hypothetical protein